nr:MAG TPA: hypothetical protein [Caudoviricetes sp.]
MRGRWGHRCLLAVVRSRSAGQFVPHELWCDCHRQSFIFDSLRGAPPSFVRATPCHLPPGEGFLERNIKNG